MPCTGVMPFTERYLATPIRAMHSRNSGSKSSTAISSTLLAWAAPICDWFWLSMNAVFTVGMLSLNLCSKPALGSPLMSDCWRTVQIPITSFALQ